MLVLVLLYSWQPSLLRRHCFHLQCVMQWAQRSRECPLCFKPLQLEVQIQSSQYWLTWPATAVLCCLGFSLPTYGMTHVHGHAGQRLE